MVNFFNRTEPFIKNCEFKNTTQCYESLNNLIGMLAPKRLNFTNSYAVRTLIACGMYNDFHFFSSLLCELELDKYIPSESMEEIIRFETERENEIPQKRTPAYREEKNKRRKKQHAKNKSSQEGDYNDDKSKPSFE